MNLVDFNTESRDLVLSNQFWLYFMVSIPLTALTLAYWKWRIRAYTSEEMKSVLRTEVLKSRPDVDMV
jgi:cell division protein FtsL